MEAPNKSRQRWSAAKWLLIGATAGIVLAFLTGCAPEPPCAASAETCAQLEIAKELRRARKAAALQYLGGSLQRQGQAMTARPAPAPTVVIPPGAFTGAGVGACYGGSVGTCAGGK